MPELTDAAKEEIRQFVTAERAVEAELREKRTQTAIALITVFGVFFIGAVGSGVYFLIDNIAKSTAEAAVAERLTQAEILAQQKSALDAIVGARAATEAAEVRAQELKERAEILLSRVRVFNQEFQERQQEMALLQPLFDAGGELASLATNQEFIDRVRGEIEAAPTGMVAAFLGTAPINEPNRHCPKGWSSYRQAWGRFIVGAGPGEGEISDRLPLEEGGDETVTLKVEEMPNHAHRVEFIERSASPPNLKALENGTGFVRRLGSNNPAALERVSFAASHRSGGNQPHNNMPPYIALYFCKKD